MKSRSINFLIIFIICVVVGMALYFVKTGKFSFSPPPKTITLQTASIKFVQPIFDGYDKEFAQQWKQQTGQTVVINHQYGASGDEMRAVIAETLNPDIFILANPYELDQIADKTGVIPGNWRSAFPNNSSPFYSAVTFVVRKGNPLGIKDWGDLTKPGVSLVFSNPKTCGGGRWVYTAALGYAMQKYNGDEVKIKDYMSKFLRNVPVYYANQSVSGDAFVNDGKGDVLITYEDFALNETRTAGIKSIEMVVPSSSVAIDIPVAVATKKTDKEGTTDAATAYLRGFYDPKIQELSTRYYLRSSLGDVAKIPSSAFPALTLFKRDFVFPTKEIESSHLDNGGLFDSLIKQ